MNVAVIFDNFGPYHLARLEAASQVTELLAVEVAASSAEYRWEKAETLKPEILKSGNNVSMSACQHVSVPTFRTVTLLERGTSREISGRGLATRLNRALEDFQPQVVFVPGWSSKAAFTALSWCVSNGVPAVAMSESTAWDETRSAGREAVKRRIVGLCSAALVGGSPHRNYMVKLGMPAERVLLGYDAVDNAYFAMEAAKWRKQKIENRNQKSEGKNQFQLSAFPISAFETAPFFLASARFVEKKNLPRLIEAYARYRELALQAPLRLDRGDKPSLAGAGEGARRAGEGRRDKNNLEGEVAGSSHSPLATRHSPPWNLVLLGDGALRESLTALRSALGLDACVHLPGFKQYPDLPAYYGLAGAFIHASTTEQWGLVVNEAMASGLPVLVSNRCGCAKDLVQEGVNGFTFDPFNVEQLAQLMLQVSGFRFQVSEYGDASRAIISKWGPDRFASGLKAAAGMAIEIGPVKPTLMQRLILKVLLSR